jgi:hypothetical protein
VLCGEPPKHDADHGHADKGGIDAAMPLEVAGQPWFRLIRPTACATVHCFGSATKR